MVWWINELEELYPLVYKFFRNARKTEKWFRTPNPLLGGISPNEMIINGRARKLKKFILNQLEENHGDQTVCR